MNIYDSIKACGKTDVGLIRQNNEDRFLVVDAPHGTYDILSHGLLFAVADGMGGHAAGEVASQMACDGLLAYYETKTGDASETGPETNLTRLEEVIRRMNQDIFRYAQKNPDCFGMGTTLSVLVLFQDAALIGHVGDSRIYRFRDNSLKRLTTDHTEAQAMIDMGYLTADEATVHPFRHALLQAVGTRKNLIRIDTRIEPLEKGDAYLLSTDGLHDLLTDEEIEGILRETQNRKEVCNRMEERALSRGGRDNITSVLVWMT